MKKIPLHFTQIHDINVPESDLEFFDVNVRFDSPLFFDPFLLKRSPKIQDQEIYRRFTVYFDEALRKAARAGLTKSDEDRLKKFFSFPEPCEVCIGFAENSIQGSGLGGYFATALKDFFLSELAKKLIGDKSMYPDGEINPEIFTVFADKVDIDGISDLSINLVMDYLINFTQEQCKKYGVTMKLLPVRQSFDFNEMEWTGGIQRELPENPEKPGIPIVLIPKHLLRERSNSFQHLRSKTIAILREDPGLVEKFAHIVSKPTSEISVEDIKEMLVGDTELFFVVAEKLEEEPRDPYDFIEDSEQILTYKKYINVFDEKAKTKTLVDGKDLFEITTEFITLFKDIEETQGGWKDTWRENASGTLIPIKEVAWGRRFRSMGLVYFQRYPQITFDTEIDSGTGLLDFRVVFKEYRVAIEVKMLSNSASTGPKGYKLCAYIHGIKIQLPEYIRSLKAQYAIYLTGQHRKRNRYNLSDLDHSKRVNEIRSLMPEVTKDLKNYNGSFEQLDYINVDLSYRPSASML